MEGGVDLEGRVALVTGGTRGIGRGIADRLAAHGAVVVVCGRNPPEDLPPDRTFITADVRDGEQAEALVAEIVEQHGRLNIVVNNAGGAPTVEAATASPRLSTSIVALNLLAPLFVGQAANRVMQEQDEGGAIVNITSVSSIRPSPGAAAYGAAKAGLLNLTETLALEWGPKVRVNCVSAGIIETEQAELYYGDRESIARVEATIPLGRMGTPADVADAVCFLASSAAGFVSGANLLVHGGDEVRSQQAVPIRD